jgi:pimeloyl-ACP methyl ester carboxylesterase
MAEKEGAQMNEPAITIPLRHESARLNGVDLHWVEAGEGKPVILLHGFPEFWYGWRRQIPALAEAGFRVIALDMRGYNRSSKPPEIDDYAIDKLTGDVRALIEHLGYAQASVVGHDWGAGVAWAFALLHPEKLERLVILNLPHPARMAAGLRTLRQLMKSWYIFFFQLPWLPEALCRAGGYRALSEAFRRDPVHPGLFTEADLALYRTAWAQPGALTAMIHYYRAFLRGAKEGIGLTRRRLEQPVLVLWGEQDRYLGKELADPPAALVPNVRVVRYPDSSHWVQHEKADAVNAELIRFLGG